MSLSPGARFGPYEIIAPLGAGGMGEVFRARDTRLDREVAIKVLPEHLSANAESRARFEREAKAVSSLNHPNICTLFDVGREGDTDYLVMELVEGETLAERLERGALPVADVLQLGAQIAEALDRAHRAGIVHRDLKPGNVMLTKSGAKLLDFGLARPIGLSEPAAERDAATASINPSPPLSAPLTSEGTIVGTFFYMSPEQLEGGVADERSDLWALGCVLYEMATGRRAFAGESQASLITSIMSSEPAPIAQVAPLSPPGLERLVQACLAKDPDDRLQSAHDIKMQLDWLVEGGSQAGVPAPVAARRRSQARLVTMLAAAGWLVAVAIAVFAWKALDHAEPEGPFFTAISSRASLDKSQSDRSTLVAETGPIALSPDGTLLATVISRGTARRKLISVYDFGDGSTQVLENTQGAQFPFWSPDSRWIGFFADGKLRKVQARGGATQTIADAFDGRGGTWNRAGVIVFAPNIHGPLMKVSANGGSAAPATRLDATEVTHRNPYFLPDGERFLFIERKSRAEAFGRLMACSLDDAEPREVLGQASNVQLSSGYLLFVREGSLVAQRFDARDLTLSGPIEPIVERLDYWNGKDVGNFSATPEGLLVVRVWLEFEATMGWYGRDGRLIETLLPDVTTLGVRASRDLKHVGFDQAGGAGQGRDIWLLDVATKQTRRATHTNTNSLIACAISSDGRRLAVSTISGGAVAVQGSGSTSSAVWIQPAAGAQNQELVLQGENFVVEDWSPDDSVLLGNSQRTDTSHDVTFIRLDDPERRVQELANTQFSETNARFSPDGAWVAYDSDESGSREVYVVDFPKAERKWRVSRDGGSRPIWSQDGTEIIFFGAGTPVAAAVTLEEVGIEIGEPEALDFSDGLVTLPVAADARRILAAQTDPGGGLTLTQVVRNWPALLEREGR